MLPTCPLVKSPIGSFIEQLRCSRVVQIAALCAFWWLGECAVRMTSLPLPGGVVGMVLVLLLLFTKRIRLQDLRGGARWLLAEMLLFFVPLVLAVLNQPQFFGRVGLEIMVVLLAGTATVMTVTALFVELCFRWGGPRVVAR